ncbi:hypothetical protein, partial [Crocosphaera sp.]|uniref:hypothetical protein n=1 Tax=Crocosphaera sp. TaxID=2729996 RepID=UPI002607E2D2
GEHPIFAKNLFLEFDGERGRWGDGGKLIRSTIINQGQFATLGCSRTMDNGQWTMDKIICYF